jgi:antitoxin (DNA-binding transcriptional repressor) of toxin-antitoxin stability system
MQTITFTDLEANLNRIADEIIANGEQIEVTRGGQVILTLSPAEPKKTYSYSPGKCAESIISMGDIVSPAEDPNAWKFD